MHYYLYLLLSILVKTIKKEKTLNTDPSWTFIFYKQRDKPKIILNFIWLVYFYRGFQSGELSDGKIETRATGNEFLHNTYSAIFCFWLMNI